MVGSYKQENITIRVIFILIFTFVISGCGSKENYSLASAKSNYIDKNYNESLIITKNILQDNPGDNVARLLLGKIYLQKVDGVSAEKEIIKAMKQGYESDEIVSLLAHAYLLQSKYDEVLAVTLDGIKSSDKYKSDIKVKHGKAYLGKGNKNLAESSFLEAIKLDSNNDQAFLGLATLRLSSGLADKGEKFVKNSIEINPDNPEAWIMRGKIYESRELIDDAKDAYNKAIELSLAGKFLSSEFQARNRIVTVQLKSNDIENASKNIDALLRLSPSNPLPKFLKATLEYKQKKYSLALDYLNAIEKRYPGLSQVQLLLGAVHYALGSYEQANVLLNRFVTIVPTHIQARKLLGATRIKLYRMDDAIDALGPLAEQSADDEQILSMIGSVAIQSGNSQSGINFLKRAARLNPDNDSIRRELARIYMSQGAFDEAIKELTSLSDKKDQNSEILLTLSYLRNNQESRAKKLIRKKIIESPNNPVWETLYGSIQLISGKRQSARAHYNNAININSDFFLARMNLARLELEDGQLSRARDHFGKILAKYGNNYKAMLGMAQIAERYGNSGEAINWLEKARSSDTASVVPRLVLARYYLKNNNVDMAKVISGELINIDKNNPDIVYLMSQVLLRQGNLNQSFKTWENFAVKNPDQEKVQFKLAQLSLKLKKYEYALKVMMQPVFVNNKWPKAKVLTAEAYIGTGQYMKALNIANDLKRNIKRPEGYMVAGDVYMARSDFQRAQTEFKAVFERHQSVAVLLKLSNAYTSDKKYNEAVTLLTEWLKLYPKDFRIQTKLAVIHQEAGNKSLAINAYKKLLLKNENNIIALNNLAGLLIDVDNVQALKYGEMAYKIAPDSSSIADTYGWVLVMNGQPKKALPVLQKASDASKNLTIRYHLAAAHKDAGNIENARKEIAFMASNKLSFSEQAHAQKLYNALK